jgi:glycosyltransferase involved in cell wall biosynthesis
MYSVVMIVRDEATRLPGALASVHGAPEIVVLDTGSRDETPELAQRSGARVQTDVWQDDFGRAREVAARAATCAWLVTLDADERFQTATGDVHGAWMRVLRRADRAGANLVLVMRHYLPGVRFWHPVAWRNGAFRWRGRLHEHLVSVGERVPHATDEIALHHRSRPRRTDYRDASRRAAIDRPDDAWLTFHHGREHALAGDFRGCEAPLQRALELRRLGGLERSEAAWLLARAAASRGDIDACARWASEAITMFPRREPALSAARALAERGYSEDARQWFRRAVTLPLPRVTQRTGRASVPYLIDRRLYQAEPLAFVARMIGK